MSEVVSFSAEAANGGANGPYARVLDGFLGTGYSTGVELSFIAGGLILVYVGYSTFRYFVPETRIGDTILTVLGFKEI